MKKYIVLAALGVLSTSVAFGALTQKEKLGYTVGYQMGMRLKLSKADMNEPSFMKGLKDAFNGKKSQLTNAEMKITLQQYQAAMMAKMKAQFSSVATKNLAAANAFLASNAKKSGVKTIESGLQYKVIKSGHGPRPAASDTVTVNYEGSLINGKVFDSSYKRGQPATFKLNQVIPGWTAALQKMQVGATWMIYISPKLAYGERGAPGAIAPNSALIFKVNLIKIVKN